MNEMHRSRTDPEAKLYRKKIEGMFGWLKEVAGIVRSRLAGRWKMQQVLEQSVTAFNVLRLRKLALVASEADVRRKDEVVQDAPRPLRTGDQLLRSGFRSFQREDPILQHPVRATVG